MNLFSAVTDRDNEKAAVRLLSLYYSIELFFVTGVKGDQLAAAAGKYISVGAAQRSQCKMSVSSVGGSESAAEVGVYGNSFKFKCYAFFSHFDIQGRHI